MEGRERKVFSLLNDGMKKSAGFPFNLIIFMQKICKQFTIFVIFLKIKNEC